jgi:opacity protein-like surface antigen
MAVSRGFLPRLLLAVAVVAVLLLLMASPAPASTVTFAAPTTPGFFITINCNSGEQFVSGMVAFYPKQGAPRPLKTLALEPVYDVTGSYYAGGGATTPNGARWYSATATCEPRPGVTTTTGNL